jgi:hypothetical protein
MWFSALLRFESSIEGMNDWAPLSEESLVLVDARDEEEALEKARRLGDERQIHYKNYAGAQVRWRFVEVLEVQEVSEPELSEGVEVHYRMQWKARPGARLWVDDLRPMPAGFDYHARETADAIDLLATDAVVEVSLDHDLGDEDGGTGYEIAKWIEERAFAWSQGDPSGLSPLRWSIHSQNPVGADRMARALRNADRFWAARMRRGELA